VKYHELRERGTSLTAEVNNMKENIQTAIEEALNSAPERKFTETVEFSFNLKDIDLKNPANRIQEEVRLPSGRGKPVRIAMFAGGEMATKARALFKASSIAVCMFSFILFTSAVSEVPLSRNS
jgi:ribosomal protein L1